MDEVHVQMEAESSCQKLCRRETNVNAELAADCADHVDGAVSPAAKSVCSKQLIRWNQVFFTGLMMDLTAAQTFFRN